MKLVRIECSKKKERISIYRLDLHPDLIKILADAGIVEIEEEHIDFADLWRIYKVMRLRRSLGVNLTGASVIVELMEKMETMDDEIKRLKKTE